MAWRNIAGRCGPVVNPFHLRRVKRPQVGPAILRFGVEGQVNEVSPVGQKLGECMRYLLPGTVQARCRLGLAACTAHAVQRLVRVGKKYDFSVSVPSARSQS